MQTVTTIPGKTYAVESEGEVIITNTETGAIAAQGDGSGQVLFTACSNSYDVSNDTAKVVALFKLAPRLKLTLLQQGVAGGVLPRGFTELEYLESSGTQHIDTGVYLSNLHNVDLIMQQAQGSASSGAVFGSQGDGNETSYAFSIYGAGVTYFGWYFYKTLSTAVDPSLVPSVTRFDILRIGVKASRLSVNGNTVRLPEVPGDFTAERTCWVFARNTSSTPTKFNGKIFSFEITGAASMKLIPALRNADGVAGMWDTVSKQFFTNAGSGTFGYRVKGTGETVEPKPYSLRDPHRVAPSGVWAKLKAENEIDVVADTEMEDGEPLGYTWHANVGDAYDAYGIVIQEYFN